MHLPGTQNTAEDLLSREHPPPGEWRLHPQVVEATWQRYGKAGVDLSPQSTTHCPLWFSQGESISPLGQDALAHAWQNQLLYAFPPLPLILPTLGRILRGNHKELLISPKWREVCGSQSCTDY